jgi:hypothetical protein
MSITSSLKISSASSAWASTASPRLTEPLPNRIHKRHGVGLY